MRGAMFGLVLAVASFMWAGPAVAAERYPVWWAPDLDLERLEDIEREFSVPFPPDQRLEFYKDVLFRRSGQRQIEWRTVHAAVAGDCEAFMAMYETDFELKYDRHWSEERKDEFSLLFYRYKRRCFALWALRRVQPAQRSFVRDFVLTKDSLDVLPAFLNFIGLRGFGSGLAANMALVPWSRFDFDVDRSARFPVLREDGILAFEVWSEHKSEKTPNPEKFAERLIRIVGRGDFDGDGLDDLMMEAEDRTFPRRRMTEQPGWGVPELYLVTRDRPGAVMRLVAFLAPLDDDDPSYTPSPEHIADPNGAGQWNRFLTTGWRRF